MLLAATDNDHGEKLVIDPGLGPSFPAEFETAIRADGTPPRAVPLARPNKLALFTARPATVDAVCVPWPSVSLADSSSSPTALSSVKLMESHEPFHLGGGGPNPSSLKLSDSGQTPVSSIPTMTWLSRGALLTS
ncbi:hypothetical protein Ccrd_011735 [Cynara cardunculus var. scolymus]|uniref:Uncharacterized protein n=1 Tax=Cynara cardunculus var. scolymus TaxID=59895 RepID=A0A118K5Z7_CYNCS|nr:hypothetical protein Ccrd_011735 [Cynara cardunculus var. scolymus]